MVLIDDLNMLIHETDRLFDLLLLKFIRLDKDNGPDLSKREIFKKFLTFLEDKCKIKKPYTLSERVCFGKIQLRSLNGREQIRILTELCQPKFDKVTNLPTALLLNNLFPQNIDPPFKFKKENVKYTKLLKLSMN